MATKPIKTNYARMQATTAPTQPDNPLNLQINGTHYKGMTIQPIEFAMANGLDACQHTIVKYVTRFREKNGIDDLLKARHVIDILIEMETNGVTDALRTRLSALTE